jgi:hypothetical protein
MSIIRMSIIRINLIRNNPHQNNPHQNNTHQNDTHQNVSRQNASHQNDLLAVKQKKIVDASNFFIILTSYLYSGELTHHSFYVSQQHCKWFCQVALPEKKEKD